MKALKLEEISAQEVEIENTLEAFQEAVGGYIETVTLVPEKVVMIVNEEGRLRGLPWNLAASIVAGFGIVGTALVVGVDGEEFCDVPENVVQKIKKKLPEGSKEK